MEKYFDIINIIDIDNGDTLGYYTNGHIDKSDFVKNVAYEFDEDISIDSVNYMFMEQQSLDEDDCDEYCENKLEFFYKDKQGRIPVTYYEKF
jgi:hypothetical protein